MPYVNNVPSIRGNKAAVCPVAKCVLYVIAESGGIRSAFLTMKSGLSTKAANPDEWSHDSFNLPQRRLSEH